MAGTKISEATLREQLKGTENIPIVDTDLPKGRTTVDKLKEYIGAGGVGEDVSGKEFTIDGEQVTAQYGAEVFNTGGIGNPNIAVGVKSHAEGKDTTAQGDYSHSEGIGTKASGVCSHAEGVGTKALGADSHAEGAGAIAQGNYSHAEGNSTTASGENSHAEGYRTTVEQNAGPGHAEGNQTIVSGTVAHAEGNGTKATGNNSHAEGQSTTASGQSSHAEGGYTKANGAYSHAEGYHTETAAGTGPSHAEGNYTKTTNSVEHAEGTYNKSNTGDAPSAQTLHSIGIGASDTNRKNAFEVMQNGDAYLYGAGGYDGTNPGGEGVKTVQTQLNEIGGKVSGTGVTQIQAVTALPESPADGVLYIITAAEETA